ncbi:MAG: T9SS type A sorting domain-containing protein [Bacteroidota bacterium]
MKKRLLLLVLLFSSSIIFSQFVNQPSQFNNVCDDNNDGIATFYMQEIGLEITGGNSNLVVTHHETQADAANGVNPLPSSYVNMTNPQTIFARIVNTVTTQVQIITYNLNVIQPPIVSPQTITACANNFQCWDLTSIIPSVSNGPNCVVMFYETQTDALVQANPIPNPACYMSVLGAPNQPPLYFNVSCNNQSSCFSVGTVFLVTTECSTSGQPQDLIACMDEFNLACFDLTVNTPNILGTLNPSDYTVTYYASQGAANAATEQLSSLFCPPTSPYVIYARLDNNAGNGTEFMTFTVTSTTHQNATVTLTNMAQCDDDNNGVIVYNLTNVQAQINSTNAFNYYTTLADAQGSTNAIANPTTYSINVVPALVAIFVREVVVGGCDLMYSFVLQNAPNCNAAVACISANPLCSSLGIPFSNTINSPNGGGTGCLNTTPNQTWFYLPISMSGPINMQISQTATAGNAIDVDYIVYGPFTNPVTPCSNPGQLVSNIVSCSYSPAAVETFAIVNALPGQYYLLMVTNFANQPGMITILQTNEFQVGAGAIDCTGLKFQAFLDSNSNGIRELGEQNFPLGQFHYEKNNDGVVHHITSPAGIYSIFDIVPTNSYDVSFSVDGAYAGMYAVSPASYDNLTIAAGSGITLYNFAVTVVQPYSDLAVTIVPLGAPRPGFTYQEKIIYTNFGNQNIASGTVTFTKDVNVTITANTQSGTTSTPTGFTYDFTNLAPFEVRTMTVSMQVPTIPTVAAGQFLVNTVTIAPLAGDVVPENNTSMSSQMIINAYDPNDKMESHGDRILHSTFTSNDYLYYTIRFENTGNASAINVRVNDVLDSQLDVNSIRMVSASHAYELDRVGNNLTWNFDNIQLPVSIENSTVGKGYITFKVKPNPGYAVGDIITNAASIYFDFNPAIVTNLFSTQFVALGINEFSNSDFVFYPNPTSDVVTVSLTNTENTITSIVVYDVLGKTIATTKVTDASSQTIDVSQLNSGMYFIEVTTDSNLKVVKKLMVK